MKKKRLIRLCTFQWTYILGWDVKQYSYLEVYIAVMEFLGEVGIVDKHAGDDKFSGLCVTIPDQEGTAIFLFFETDL